MEINYDVKKRVEKLGFLFVEEERNSNYQRIVTAKDRNGYKTRITIGSLEKGRFSIVNHTSFFGGDAGLKLRQKRDKVKYKYCQNNDINLLIIPYWDFNNIEKILSEFFISNTKRS
jgi:hypothetical protein